MDLFTDRDAGRRSPLHAEHLWNHAVQVVLFLFGLVNAGVMATGYGTATWAVLTAAMVGRPVGVLAAFAGARAIGFHAPAGFHRRDLVVVALASSCSFTFGLFFAAAIYPPGAILGELKMGAFATGVGTIAALLAARGLGVGGFTHHAGSSHLKEHHREHLQHARV
jgi:NhaA family Na+:H+ antiporter